MSGGTESEALVAAWREAVQRPEIAEAIGAIHARVASEVAARRPLCLASGNCCRFESFGHRLMVVGLEVAWTMAQPSTPPCSLPQIESARREGRCPFLDDREGRLCGIRAGRPMPCRTFFCDRAANGWQQELHEACLAELKSLHERFEVPYRYLEWRDALEMFARQPPLRSR